jgi:hypothetical protein
MQQLLLLLLLAMSWWASAQPISSASLLPGRRMMWQLRLLRWHLAGRSAAAALQ